MLLRSCCSQKNFFSFCQIVNERLFTASHDGTVRVWTLRNVREDGVHPNAGGGKAKGKGKGHGKDGHHHHHHHHKNGKMAPQDEDYDGTEDQIAPPAPQKEKIEIDDMFSANRRGTDGVQNEAIFLTNGFSQR